MFTQADPAKAIADLKSENRGLFDEIKKFVDKWVSKLKAYYKGKTISEEGAEVAKLESFEKIQKLFMEAMEDAGKNFSVAEVTDEKSTTPESDVKVSGRSNSGYGGIREVLAKKGLDALSKRYGDRFPLSSKFDVAMRADDTKLTMETVQAGSVKTSSKESAYKAGRKAFIAKYGTSTSVHIKQMDIDAKLYADIAGESISKSIGQPNEQSTLDIIPHIREILSNSVLMGIERIRHTDDKGTVLYGYRLYNLYWYSDGKTKTPHAIACTVLQDLNKAEGYVFQNIENVTIGQGLPGGKPDMSLSVNDDTYTVAQLYTAVKKISRENGGLSYTQEEKDAYGFAYTETDDGERYSLRNEEVDNSARGILMRMDVKSRKLDAEKYHLGRYQERVTLLGESEQRLAEVKAEIGKLSTDEKGNRKELTQLRSEQRNLNTTIKGLKRDIKFTEQTDMFRKMVADGRLAEYRAEQREAEKARILEYRAMRNEITGMNDVMSVMEDEFVRLARD